jgi:hypothetical protein
MGNSNSKLSFIGFLLLLPINFVYLVWQGYKTTNKKLLIPSLISTIVVSYFILEIIDIHIPYLLGENLNSLNQSNVENIVQKYSVKTGRNLSFDNMFFTSKALISVVYPSLILLSALGIKELKQRILCFLSNYICLVILLVLKNFYYYQQVIAYKNGIDTLLDISYIFLSFYVISLIFSNITFSKIKKGLIGLIFSITYLIAFISIYWYFNGNTKIYDVISLYSIFSLIINYFILKKILTNLPISFSLLLDKSKDITKYDVFISYRRNKNMDAAKLIRTALISKKIRAFVDIEDLGSKHFDEKLTEIIRNTENYILLVSPDDLIKCVDSNDWIRKEISTAIRSGRNIIPILKDGFKWDEITYLPDDISDIKRHNSINYSQEYFDAMIMKIISFLENSALKQKKQII